MRRQPSDKIDITCDRSEGAWLVGLWKGTELYNLYVDSIESPTVVGATAAGRIVRSLPSQNAAFIDCGLDKNVFVAAPATLKAGDEVLVSIISVARQNKAHCGKLIKTGPGIASASGIVTPPPRPWQRALSDLKEKKIASITFSNKYDYNSCLEWIEKSANKFLPYLKPLSKNSAHPELDDLISELINPVVQMPGGTSIVIEQTEALAAIDINGDAQKNPLSINLQAVPEIARQVRLRNLSGIIVVDALKMLQRTDAHKLVNALKDATSDDPIAVDVFGITKLGLIEMTRARTTPSLAEAMIEARRV